MDNGCITCSKTKQAGNVEGTIPEEMETTDPTMPTI
jgi:hypothetical protein